MRTFAFIMILSLLAVTGCKKGTEPATDTVTEDTAAVEVSTDTSAVEVSTDTSTPEEAPVGVEKASE